MAVVTVGTTPTRLTASDLDHRAGQSLQFRVPADGQVVYVDIFSPREDEADLTPDTGVNVKPDEAWAADLHEGEHVWAVVAAGTQDVRVTRRGV